MDSVTEVAIARAARATARPRVNLAAGLALVWTFVLGNAGGVFGLGGFLREHYTASRESASAVAAYLNGVRQGATPKRVAKPPERRKPAAARSAQAEPAAKKPKASASAKPKQPE